MNAEELYKAGLDAYNAEDYGKALEYFQLAADLGNAEGLRGIGNLYDYGLGVDQSYDKALEYYRLAADKGDTKSIANIGSMYVEGLGVEQDYSKAMEYNQKAVDLGEPAGFYGLGLMYLYGDGVEQDIGKAIEYFERSGELGLSNAYAILGSLYQYGEGVEKDIGKAAEYYQKAADLGETSVCYTLGTMYYSGEGVEQDYYKAAAYYQTAADLGVVRALCDLGMMYYTGEGVGQDYGRAADYLAQAAEQEVPAAMFVLGECLRLGQGLEKDSGKATEWYAGKGDIPMDAVGITWIGLKRASENPKIKNILLDLSVNGGGSLDMLAYMIDLMFGDQVVHGYNVLTGQREHAMVHSDKNLDGVFDEKDDEVKYDFNYAVLTTRATFSCGNLMPFLMQEHGAVLLGEPTGGGSCSIQMGTLTNGGQFYISSYLLAFRDENGESVEGGCKTDLPIARIEPETPTHEDPLFSNGDYTPYFDDVMLDQMINEWFEEQAEAPAA